MTQFTNQMPKWLFYALVMLICGFLMTGCGSDGDGGNNDNPAPNEETSDTGAEVDTGGTDTGGEVDTGDPTETDTDTDTVTDTNPSTDTNTDTDSPVDNNPAGLEGIDDLVGNYTLQDYEINMEIMDEPITPDHPLISFSGTLSVDTAGDVAINSIGNIGNTTNSMDISFHILQRIDATHIDVEGDPVTVDGNTMQCERTVLEIGVAANAVTLHTPEGFCDLPVGAAIWVYQRNASVQALSLQTDAKSDVKKINTRSELEEFIEDMTDYLETQE